MSCFGSIIWKKPEHFRYELVDVQFFCITGDTSQVRTSFNHKKVSKYTIHVCKNTG